MNTRAKLIAKLQEKAYRDAFVGSQINIELPIQIRALRERRGWTQGELAKRTGMVQPRISAIETPGKGKLNLETLRRLAAAFDVGLIVRFAPFSEMIEWGEKFSPDSFDVPSFEIDIKTYTKINVVTPYVDRPLGLFPSSQKGMEIIGRVVATTPAPTATFQVGYPEAYQRQNLSSVRKRQAETINALS